MQFPRHRGSIQRAFLQKKLVDKSTPNGCFVVPTNSTSGRPRLWTHTGIERANQVRRVQPPVDFPVVVPSAVTQLHNPSEIMEGEQRITTVLAAGVILFVGGIGGRKTVSDTFFVLCQWLASDRKGSRCQDTNR